MGLMSSRTDHCFLAGRRGLGYESNWQKLFPWERRRLTGIDLQLAGIGLVEEIRAGFVVRRGPHWANQNLFLDVCGTGDAAPDWACVGDVTQQWIPPTLRFMYWLRSGPDFETASGARITSARWRFELWLPANGAGGPRATRIPVWVWFIESCKSAAGLGLKVFPGEDRAPRTICC